jgi:hypothetical protein
MIEIEKYPCNDINEACERERYYFELSNAKLNTNCSARNDKEYRKYNRNKIQEYHEKNKNKINAMRKIPYICDICNGKYTHNNRAKHFNIQKHQTAVNNNNQFLFFKYSSIKLPIPSFLNSDSFCQVESAFL